MSIAKFFLLSAVLFLASGLVSAQSTPSPLPTEKPATFDGKRNPKEDKSHLRELSGVVKDDSGTPIVGAIVQIKDTKTGRVIDFITKQTGAYEFHELDMNID